MLNFELRHNGMHRQISNKKLEPHSKARKTFEKWL